MQGRMTPLLTTTDWNAEWKRLQDARQHADDASKWDERAKTFPVKHGSQEGYVSRFLELAGIRPGETVLDMGCGTGALATPLAQRGHTVIACDFSRGMLEAMVSDQEELGVESVKPVLMSWDDDWESCGISEKSADVAIASRSIATYDLEGALAKLERSCRRRACITVPCGPSPKIDDRLLAAAGIQRHVGRDFLYAFNILVSKGSYPEVAYIPSSRMETFESFDEALDTFTRIVTDAARGLAGEAELDAVPKRLETWLEDELVHDQAGYHLAMPRHVTWAFLAWSPAR